MPSLSLYIHTDSSCFTVESNNLWRSNTFLNFFLQISIQRCDEDGDNRLRVCYSACELYNTACGAGLDCSDQTLFSKREEEEKGVPCTGYGEKKSFWLMTITSPGVSSLWYLHLRLGDCVKYNWRCPIHIHFLFSFWPPLSNCRIREVVAHFTWAPEDRCLVYKQCWSGLCVFRKLVWLEGGWSEKLEAGGRFIFYLFFLSRQS